MSGFKHSVRNGTCGAGCGYFRCEGGARHVYAWTQKSARAAARRAALREDHARQRDAGDRDGTCHVCAPIADVSYARLAS